MADRSGKITLGDGREYELSPLTLKTITDVERRFGSKLTELADTQPLQVMLYLLYLRLRTKYPNLTEEDVGNLVPISKFSEVIKIVSK